jgi:hypothetical protein
VVKRKTSLDAAEKASKTPKTSRKVSKRLNFDGLSDIVSGGVLLVKRGDEVFFERKKESRLVVCVGTVTTVYTEGRYDGVVDVWDETHEESYGFNWKKDLDKVRVRMIAAKEEVPNVSKEEREVRCDGADDAASGDVDAAALNGHGVLPRQD